MKHAWLIAACSIALLAAACAPAPETKPEATPETKPTTQASPASPAAKTPEMVTATLKVEGMDCSSCRSSVQAALFTGDPNVEECSVSPEGVVVVKYKKDSKTTPEQLVAIVNDKTDFKASLAAN